MKIINYGQVAAMLVIALAFLFSSSASAQNQAAYEVLDESDSAKIIPQSFYFAGQSAPTQMRNASAARIGKDRFVLAGLVDTSGYSTEISGKYEGFFITDSAIRIGNKTLGVGAYGFGFSKDGRINIFDLSGKQIMFAASRIDPEMKRPRPLQMESVARGVRFYKGRNFVLISRI